MSDRSAATSSTPLSTRASTSWSRSPGSASGETTPQKRSLMMLSTKSTSKVAMVSTLIRLTKELTNSSNRTSGSSSRCGVAAGMPETCRRSSLPPPPPARLIEAMPVSVGRGLGMALPAAEGLAVEDWEAAICLSAASAAAAMAAARSRPMDAAATARLPMPPSGRGGRPPDEGDGALGAAARASSAAAALSSWDWDQPPGGGGGGGAPGGPAIGGSLGSGAVMTAAGAAARASSSSAALSS